MRIFICLLMVLSVSQLQAQYSKLNYTLSYPFEFNNQGKPLALETELELFSAQFHQALAFVLPESQDLRTVRPDLFEESARVEIYVTQPAEVFVSFYHEGAGYKNALGYYSYIKGQEPQSPRDVELKIAVPNYSARFVPNTLYSGGGDMVQGEKLNLGLFPANSVVRFFVVANGWNSGRQRVDTPSKGMVFDRDDWNDGPLALDKQQSIMLWDETEQRAVIAFEDILNYSGGDHDFNDAIFMVESNPPEAVEVTQKVTLQELSDSDGDGVIDPLDEFPQDSSKNVISYYPAKDSQVLMGYEDLFPSKGDYDFNDLVVGVYCEQDLDGATGVQEIRYKVEVKAMGAGYPNGLKLRLGVPASKVETMHLASSRLGILPVVVDESEPGLTVRIFENAHQEIQKRGSCKFSNTEADCQEVIGSEFSLTIKFLEPVNLETENVYSNLALVQAPFDLFLYRTNQESLEIHMPGIPGTNKFDNSLLGSGDSDPEQHFLTKYGHPWVMQFPDVNFDWPIERVDIIRAYPFMQEWVETAGSKSSDWYIRGKRNQHLWRLNQ